MSSLQNVIGTLPGYLIYFAAALLTAAQLAVLLRTIRETPRKARIIIALLHFLTGFFLLGVFLDYSYNILLEGISESVHPIEQALLDLPWLLYAALDLGSAAVILWYLKAFRKHRDTNLSTDSIRQTVDLLPTGILISEPDGTVRLANLCMAQLCRTLTGELLSDAKRFWQHIERTASDGLLIHTPDGETWQFAKNTITLDGKDYDQITATDMTQQYRLTEELSDKNRQLHKVQDQMKAVAAKERSLAAAREVMNARMTVHDRMGAVLLSGKYYLDHPENVKEEELLHLLEFNNHFLLGEALEPENAVHPLSGEAKQPGNETDPLQKALETANRIGVTVKISGEFPKDKTIRNIFAQAVEQCAANTVRHAGGDLLNVVIEENETKVTASFSNNGLPPKAPVTETGGLAVLRKSVENAGGSMEIQSMPSFLLTISM